MDYVLIFYGQDQVFVNASLHVSESILLLFHPPQLTTQTKYNYLFAYTPTVCNYHNTRANLE